jgi:CBS domain-containing protein
MKVIDFTLREPVVIEGEASVREAATVMADAGVGALIVCDRDRPVGIVTDRDIVTRGVSRAIAPDARIDTLMSTNLIALDDEAEFDDLLHVFTHHAVRRVPVVRHDRVVGVVSLDDVLVSLAGNLGDVTHVLAGQIMFPHAADEPPVPAVS